MQPALPALATWQRHVKRFGLQLRLQLRISQCLPTCIERRLNRLLGQVDGCAARLLFVHWQRGQALHQFGHTTGLAQVLRFAVFKIGGRVGLLKRVTRLLNHTVQIIHRIS